MGSPSHFEEDADGYATARPPYPDALYAVLKRAGALRPGCRVLEIGAGTGQATTELLARGCVVTAVEPGARLAAQLRSIAPAARVLQARVEDAELPAASFDTVIAATSMHWVDLDTVLPRLHRSLVPGGRLAVWRTIFGDPRVRTPFRNRLANVRPPRSPVAVLDPRPTVEELERGGCFIHQETWSHPWHLDLTPEQVGRLFATFSDWTPEEVAGAVRAARDAGPVVREHYVTHLHLLRRSNARHCGTGQESR